MIFKSPKPQNPKTPKPHDANRQFEFKSKQNSDREKVRTSEKMSKKVQTPHQMALIAKCMQDYGNKDDTDMMTLLLRTQKNVCSVKTTKQGHRDRFEMDLLSRIQKIRTAKVARRPLPSQTENEPSVTKDSHNLSKEQTSEIQEQEQEDGDGDEEEEQNEATADTHQEKYDIRKQIQQLNASHYAKFEGVPKNIL